MIYFAYVCILGKNMVVILSWIIMVLKTKTSLASICNVSPNWTLTKVYQNFILKKPLTRKIRYISLYIFDDLSIYQCRSIIILGGWIYLSIYLQEDGLNPPAPTLARVTVREKRFSLFCCKWRNRYFFLQGG